MGKTEVEGNSDAVFISYSRKDEAFARVVASGLSSRGLTTWIDREDIPPASDWMKEINEGMASADGLVVIITQDWADSKVCGTEVDEAIQLGKRVVPVLRTMAENLHPEVASRNWVFWRDDGEAAAALDGIEEALRVDPDWTREHTTLLQQALRWKARPNDKSLLLRGQELSNAEVAIGLPRPEGVPQVTPLQRQFAAASRAASTSRLRRLVITALVVAAVSIGLAVAAVLARQEANRQRAEAVRQEGIAIEQRDEADRQRDEADRQRAEAVRQEGIAIEQRDEADRQRAEAILQRDTARSTALASQAANNVEAEIDLAALLALEAFRTKDTVDARGSLLQVLGATSRFAGREARHEAPITTLVHHEATNVAASADIDGIVVLWDTDPIGQRPATSRADSIDAAGTVTSMAFGADGSTLVVATETDGVETWDVASSPPRNTAVSVAAAALPVLSSDGEIAVGFALDDDGELALTAWDVEADELLGGVLLEFDTNDLADLRPTPIAMSRDATRVATGIGNEIVVWNLAEPEILVIDIAERNLPNVADLALTIHSLEFLGDGTQIAFGIDEGDIFVTNVDGPAEGGTAFQATPPPTSAARDLTTIAFTDDSGETLELLASAHNNGEVKMWILAEGSPFEFDSLRGHDEEALAVTFTSGGALASASWDGDVIWWRGTPTTQLGRALLTPGESRSHPFDIEGAEYVRDDLIVTVDGDGQMLAWDPLAGGPVDQPIGNDVTSIAEADELLALGSADGSITLVDLGDGSTSQLGSAFDDPVRLLAVSVDGSMVVSVQDDHIVGLWDVGTSTLIGEAELPDGMEVAVVAFPTPDQLWVGGDIVTEAISVAFRIDVETGEVIETARHNDDENGHVVTSIALSPDGSTLATGGSDRRIFVWDTTDFSTATAELARHRDVVNDLVFLDDAVLLAGDGEGRVLMWDVGAGRAVGELTGPTDGVRALDLRGDRTHLIAAGEDDTLRIWDMRIETWLDGACELAGRNMTAAEWDRFRLGDSRVRHCDQFGDVTLPLAEYETSET